MLVFKSQAPLTSPAAPSNMKDVVFDDFSSPEASAVQQVLATVASFLHFLQGSLYVSFHKCSYLQMDDL